MHAGIVCKIKELHPIQMPNGATADSIQRAIVCGYSTIVTKEYKVGDLGVFFLGGDIQLSEEFCKANNLLVTRDPETGKKSGGGYIEEDRRVRVVKLLGVKSEGLFAPLKYFNYLINLTGNYYFPFIEGDEFSSCDGHEICTRFEHKNVKTAKENKRHVEKLKRQFSTDCFAQHQQTSHFLLNLSKIPLLSLLYITIKLHGTSGRTGNVLVNTPNNKFITDLLSKLFGWFKNKTVKRWIKKLHDKLSTYRKEYKLVSGTRQTIIHPNKTGYYNDNFRQSVEQKYFKDKLRKGEVVYYEIVGFQENGKPIMQSQSVKKLKDKSMEAIYGPTMHYTYGCEPGKCDVYVYRITQVNEDGHAVELSWPQVKARCAELNIKHVPEASPLPIIYMGDEYTLKNFCDYFIDRQSTIDPRHIEEGVCIRIEKGSNIQILKHKGFKFRALESSAKEDDSYEDLEESS